MKLFTVGPTEMYDEIKFVGGKQVLKYRLFAKKIFTYIKRVKNNLFNCIWYRSNGSYCNELLE